LSLSTEPVDAQELVAEIASTLEPTAARADIRVSVTAGPPRLPLVTADRTRLAQIVMNYGSNAIKYNRPGGSVAFVLSTPSPGRVRIAVRDDGLGIPADKQHKVFQPFQRAGQEAGPIEGTGIGLAISKQLAELMRGSVGFHSVAGHGSEFWLELPADSSRISQAPPRNDDAGLRLDTRRAGLVLYVEDNPANIALMRDVLSGFPSLELVVATNAETGVELARERIPDVILMDINLPGMSGLEGLAALRESAETRDIPVIALTAAASRHDRERGQRAGFYRYLTKPVKVAELEEALETLFAR
jgi:CheY-like chemotaxis protein